MPLPIRLTRAYEQQPDAALVRMAFGTTLAGAIAHTGLEPLGDDAVIETWGETAPLRSGQCGDVVWHCDDECLFGHAVTAIGADTEAATHHLYRQILSFTAQSDFPNLLRVWHYLPRINAGDGDQEHYRRFCIGRARAFEECRYAPEQLPAGTGIGSRTGDELLIYFIATRQPGHQIENPRQVSAFDYPRRYGPRQPLFSRATVWSDSRNTRLVVSGTASIVGHESRHSGDLQEQLAEMWRNLDSLCTTAGAGQPEALRVYVRHTEDFPAIRAFVSARVPADTAVVYLHADICRAELLVEIEGVYTM